MKNLFLKQGTFRESETEKGFLKDFNLNKWIKKAFDFFNVPYVDNCCTAPTSSPMRYNSEFSTIQNYNATNDSWQNIPETTFGLKYGTFKANYTISVDNIQPGGTVIGAPFDPSTTKYWETILENTLGYGCDGYSGFGNPIVTIVDAPYQGGETSIRLNFPNACSNPIFLNANITCTIGTINYNTSYVTAVSVNIIDPYTTVEFVTSQGINVDALLSTLIFSVEINVPLI